MQGAPVDVVEKRRAVDMPSSNLVDEPEINDSECSIKWEQQVSGCQSK